MLQACTTKDKHNSEVQADQAALEVHGVLSCALMEDYTTNTVPDLPQALACNQGFWTPV